MIKALGHLAMKCRSPKQPTRPLHEQDLSADYLEEGFVGVVKTALSNLIDIVNKKRF
jgi:hypothetical protein